MIVQYFLLKILLSPPTSISCSANAGLQQQYVCLFSKRGDIERIFVTLIKAIKGRDVEGQVLAEVQVEEGQGWGHTSLLASPWSTWAPLKVQARRGPRQVQRLGQVIWREREWSVTAISGWRFFLHRYHKYYHEKANLAKFDAHWISTDCSFAIILTYHWEICVDYLTFIILGGRVLSLPLPFSRLRWKCKLGKA